MRHHADLHRRLTLDPSGPVRTTGPDVVFPGDPSEARVRTRFVALLLTAALLPYAAGCARHSGAAPAAPPSAALASDGLPSAAPNSAALPSAALPSAALPSTGTAFGGTDLAWIEINIAMNDQLLPLLRLVPDHSHDAALTRLCGRLQSSVTTELATLHRLHDQAGLPAQNPHEGMTMPGLIPADAVTGAAALSGAAFDAKVTAQLKPYLEQSRRLAEDEQRAGTDPQTRALAAGAATTRDSALHQLTA